jgi:hypothetical protein
MLPVLVEFLRNMGIDVTFGKPATQKLVNEVNDKSCKILPDIRLLTDRGRLPENLSKYT